MKKFSKNILLITALVLVNLAIFLFCKILTDEGNFTWYKISPEKKWLISLACMNLMRTKYFIYANSINFFLLGIYFGYYYRKTLGVIISLIGVMILVVGTLVFEEEIVENYYIIFKNQSVPEDFTLDPVKSAGKGIGKYLLQDVHNNLSIHRQQAIAGLGQIRYEPATDLLNTILHDLTEKPEVRGEAYLALLRMESDKAASFARIFMASTHPIADQATVDYIEERSKRLR